MNLSEYVRILVRRGWIMLLLALLAGGGAWFITRDDTPVYQATQRILIQPSRPDLSLTESSSRILEPLRVYLDSRERAQEVIDMLQLDMTPGQLLADTSTAADQFRFTIQIEVESTSQQVAVDAARAWGQLLIEYREELNAGNRREDRVDARPVDAPTVGQIAPSPRIVGIAGAILGLIVGGVIVFVLEYVESSVVRRRDDLERSLDLDVLAVIPSFDA